MSLPTNPQSRSEEYLNAIATGSTSNLPEPESRMDAYLDYIARNGGGGGGGGVTVCPVTAVYDSENSDWLYTATMTAGELWEAAQTGFVVFTWREGFLDNHYTDHSQVATASYSLYDDGLNVREETYSFTTSYMSISADSASDYPQNDLGGGGGPK